jgi:HSP20 family protein
MTMLTPIWNESRSPWRELRAVQRDLDRLFDGWLPTTSPERTSDAILPSYDVQETDNAFLVSVDIPGVRPENVKASVKDGRLEVSAESRGSTRERRYRVTFTLPAEVDDARLEASLEHGVLTLALPKAAKPEGREIPIQAGGAQGPTWLERFRGKKEAKEVKEAAGSKAT